MDRRQFLKSGSLGLGGLALGGANLGWLIRDAVAASNASGTPWKFGVMADTQWANGADMANPGYCAVNIINALNQQFIDQGVKFVVQVGDLVDKESWTNPSNSKAERSLNYRAAAAQPLYDAGIGFFPLRGNHEASVTAAAELPSLFPQTLGQGDNLFGVSQVVSSSINGLVGLSYAIDVENVRIVLLDQFTRKDGSGSTNNNILDQLSWVDQTLANRSSDTHAFVMAHKNLIGQNHADCLFGSNATSNTTGRNSFIASLQANKVGYFMGGHDHMHHRSVIASPDGTAKTEQIICSSNSYKFYIPKSTPNDTTGREKVIAQELFSVGYYIYTIDGPCVTVEFYSSSHNADYGDVDLSAPLASYNFYLRERFGYSLNGKQFSIANGESYTSVLDSYGSTTAKILDGSNEDRADDSDYSNREEIKTVKTGWRPAPSGAASAVLKLWGLENNLNLFDASLTGYLPDQPGTSVADVFALSLSYDASKVRPSKLISGSFCLQAKDGEGNWVNAVSLNDGGVTKFVYGPWKSGYGLGTYGVDPKTRTVWAVLNRAGDFVAA